MEEGRKNFLYKDSLGKWTIGVGRCIEDRGLSNDEIDYLLRNDINMVISQCEKLSFWNNLTDNRKIVIADMIFNMGIIKFKTFVHMISAIISGDYKSAADHMLDSLWEKQVGDRAIHLAEMMRNG